MVLKLGIPKGSLQEATVNLFKKAGFKDIHVVPRTTGWRGWGVKR